MEPKLKVYRWRGDIENAFVDSIGPNGFCYRRLGGLFLKGVLRRLDLVLQLELLGLFPIIGLSQFRKQGGITKREEF